MTGIDRLRTFICRRATSALACTPCTGCDLPVGESFARQLSLQLKMVAEGLVVSGGASDVMSFYDSPSGPYRHELSLYFASRSE